LLIVIGIYFYASGSARVERKPVLAVLPFRSLDGQDESLVAGMWEDTRTAIGRNPQLIVLGPNSAQALAGKSGGAVAKAADYVIEASVRTAGDRIRVSADLVRTRDGEQLWSQDFDRKLDDVFALQSDIASEIEGRIRGRLAEKGGVTPEHIATSGDVYALYSDARAKIRSRAGPDDVTLAHSELEQVVKADPNFAPGWAALAEVIGEIPPSEKRWQLTDSAEVYARKAIDLAPNLAAAHAAMAYALKLNGPIARSELERAVQLDPNDFEALTWLGNMRFGAGDKRGAIISYRRAAEVEPFFWPAVFNLYTSLQDVGDRAGMQQLIEQENAVGADYLATAVKIDDAYHRGDLANAANLGLAYWKTGPKEGRPAIRVSLWTVMLELGFVDEAAKLGPAPDFAPALWKLDPKGLDMMESHHIDVRTFFMLQPLTENASRVYLLSGRSKKLADMYLSLKMSPSAFLDMTNFGGDPDGMHFILSAPLIALALKENGRAADATALLTLAEQRAKARAADGKPEDSALLARIYAAEGRKEEAIALIVGAINRGWLPQPPELLPDLHSDPAFASLKGDPRFERSRQQLLGTIARERAQVNLQLLPQLSTA
jgi:TolB-like protein/tetratricopeptide (TPR) repeat protein